MSETLFARFPRLIGTLCAVSLILVMYLLYLLLDPHQRSARETRAAAVMLEAAARGDTHEVTRALDRGLSVNSTNDCGWSALMQAAAHGHPDTLEALLARGAALELRDQAGYSALMLAVVNDQQQITAMLLGAGANPQLADTENGWTALIWAARNGNLSIVEQLLQAGANPQQPASDGRTAIDWAREASQADLFNRLQSALENRPATSLP